MVKYATDYGVLIEMFLGALAATNEGFEHKSFTKKIQNKIDRYHKRRHNMCAESEVRCKNAVMKAQADFKENGTEISLGAVCWLIHNRHKEELKPYNFDPKSFDQLNKYFNAQGVILPSSRVLTVIESYMYG